MLCTGARVTEEEKTTIINYIEKPEIRKHLENQGLDCEKVKESISAEITLPKIGETCIFFSNSSCLIHSIKPWVCITYPLMLQTEDDRLIIYVDVDCQRGRNIAKELRNGAIPSWLGTIPKRVEVREIYFYEVSYKEHYG